MIECKINNDRIMYWYLNGKLHREDGPAVEYLDGTKEWHRNGELHREDGPAIEWWDGETWWYQNGLCHRDGGPAVVRPNGRHEWWIWGKQYSVDDYTMLQFIK